MLPSSPDAGGCVTACGRALAVAAVNGRLYLVALHDGALLSSFDTGGQMRSCVSPIAARNTLFRTWPFHVSLPAVRNTSIRTWPINVSPPAVRNTLIRTEPFHVVMLHLVIRATIATDVALNGIQPQTAVGCLGLGN